MTGICSTYSVDESLTVITSTYSIIGNLSAKSFVVTSFPQNTNNFDWVPLSIYFDNLNGFKYRLYNSMTPRTDTALLNNPPITIMDPVFTIQYGWEYEITIPTFDVNEDVLLCKYSSLPFFY